MTWLISKAVYENLPSLPVQGVESLAEAFSAGAQSVQLSETHMRQAFSWRDKMTDRCPFSRFGVMSPHLTGALGKVLLTLYLAGFPVRTYQSPVKGLESTVNDQVYGASSPELLTKLDRDTLLWKTVQPSPEKESTEFLGTWPRWGMMRNGACWAVTPSVVATKDKEYGSWPTPQAHDWKGSSGRSLKGEECDLPTRVKMWPTPCATDHRGAGKTGELRDRLDYAVERGGTKSKSYDSNVNGGQLNPDWVEWLMGWPIGWTRLQPINASIWRSNVVTMWIDEPAIPRADHNIPNRVDRLRCVGNGQVPLVAMIAFTV